MAELARRHGAPKPTRQGQANVAPITIGGQEILLATTRTFMNDSGRAVQGLIARHHLRDLSEILIVLDEMELPLGTLRLRPGGSDAGHNGLKSVIQSIGGSGFPRLRIGVGRPPLGVDPIEHVLSRLRPEERKVIDAAVSRAATAVESWVENGILKTMDRFNRPARALGAEEEP